MNGFSIPQRRPWPIGVFRLLTGLPGVSHGVTTRDGPAFGTDAESDATRRATAATAAALGLKRIAWVKQVHGATVLKAHHPGLIGRADSLVTDMPDLATAMLEHLTGELGVRSLTVRAAIAPSAGPCCYEVGDEVVDAAVDALGAQSVRFFSRPRGAAAGRAHFDLWEANKAQLLESGVPAARVVCSGLCTICHGERFWSWRRQKERAGRFAAAIGIQV